MPRIPPDQTAGDALAQLVDEVWASIYLAMPSNGSPRESLSLNQKSLPITPPRKLESESRGLPAERNQRRCVAAEQ